MQGRVRVVRHIEVTSEELEEMRKKEARKDRLHQNYLKRKANGKQKEYEERIKAKKKAQMQEQKEQIRLHLYIFLICSDI